MKNNNNLISVCYYPKEHPVGDSYTGTPYFSSSNFFSDTNTTKIIDIAKQGNVLHQAFFWKYR